MTVTFKNNWSIKDYLNLVTQFNLDIREVDYLGTENTRGRMTVKDKAFDERLALQFTSDTGSTIIGITGFNGYVNINEVLSLQNTFQVLLVDPLEDLQVRDLKKEYEQAGFLVTVLSTDLWPFYQEILNM